MTAFVKIALVAISMALDVIAVCIAVGVGRPSIRRRLRIGGAFCVAEVSMTALGAGIGHVAGDLVGDVASYLGFAALFGIGIYMIVESLRSHGNELDLSTGWGLTLGALSISIDQVGIGFTLPYLGVPLAAGLATVVVVSCSSTALGLTLGGWLGAGVGAAAGLVAGVLLTLTGLGFGVAHALGVGG